MALSSSECLYLGTTSGHVHRVVFGSGPNSRAVPSAAGAAAAAAVCEHWDCVYQPSSTREPVGGLNCIALSRGALAPGVSGAPARQEPAEPGEAVAAAAGGHSCTTRAQAEGETVDHVLLGGCRGMALLLAVTPNSSSAGSNRDECSGSSSKPTAREISSEAAVAAAACMHPCVQGQWKWQAHEGAHAVLGVFFCPQLGNQVFLTASGQNRCAGQNRCEGTHLLCCYVTCMPAALTCTPLPPALPASMAHSPLPSSLPLSPCPATPRPAPACACGC